MLGASAHITSLHSLCNPGGEHYLHFTDKDTGGVIRRSEETRGWELRGAVLTSAEETQGSW